MFPQFWNNDQDEYNKISKEVRKLQNELLSRRVRRPFVSGLTSCGLNYIDTRPIDDNNGTVLSHNSFSPSSNDTLSHLPPLPPHEITNSDKMNVTIVLSHGFSQGLGMWTENIDEISAFYNVNRVVAFDWRGMGGSERRIDDVPMRSPMAFFEQYLHHEIRAAENEQIKQQCKITNKIRSKLGLSPQCDSQNTPISNNNPQTSSSSSSSLTPTPNAPANLFTTSLRTILHPLTMYTSEETKRSIEENLISPTATIFSSLYQTLDHTLSFDKYVESSISKSSTPQKSVDYFIDPLIPMFKELQLDEQPVILISHSLGGLLSAHFCKKYPGLVHGLVLVSPAGVSEGMGLTKDKLSDLSGGFLTGSSIIGNQADVVETVLNSSAALGQALEEQEHQEKLKLHNPSSSSTTTTMITDENNNTTITTTTTLSRNELENKLENNEEDNNSVDFNSNTILQKQHPKIISGVLYDIMGSLWKLNLLQPQTILRLLPNSAAKWISNGMAIRMHNEGVMGDEDRKILSEYLEALLTAPPVGEYAMNSILNVDYPKKEFSKNIGKDLHSESTEEILNQFDSFGQDKNESTYEDNLSSDERFMQFIKHTYDYKRQVKLRDYLNQQRQLEREEKELEKDHQNNPNDPQQLSKYESFKQKKNGDSNFWRPRPEEIDNPHSDIRTPSVFARAPLSLTKVLPHINIPIEFVYGDDDWLYQGDVPFIVRNLSNFYKTVKESISHWVTAGDNNNTPKQLMFESTVTSKDPLPKALYHNYTGISDDSNNGSLQIDPDNDVSSPYSSIHTDIPVIDTAFERKRALTMLNVSPTVSLDIVSNAGHHLYGNNAGQFHRKIRNFVENIAVKPFEEKVKEINRGKYDPSYTKGLLSKYWHGYQKKIKVEKKDKEIREEIGKVVANIGHHQSNFQTPDNNTKS
jgi:pimeloyl-ACP methyl ester carboxylesterase